MNANRSKMWMYTDNNYSYEEKEQLMRLVVNVHRSGIEVGESGTVHLQGCIKFPSDYRFPALKKLFPRFHWEVVKSWNHVYDYCSKGDVWLDVDNRQQGKRTDLMTVVKTVQSGGTPDDLSRDHPLEYIKYHSGLDKLCRNLAPRTTTFQKVEVLLFTGPSRSGKTRAAYEYDPKLYRVPYVSKGGKVWFDGYHAQETILFDDFYGEIEYPYMLQLLDNYPLQLQCKGGFVHKNWKTIIITSNSGVQRWYTDQDTIALRNRITKKIKYPLENGSKENIQASQDNQKETTKCP